MYDQSRNRGRGPKPEWKEGARFTVDGLTAVVSVMQGYRPRYSVQVGRVREDGNFIAHIPVQSDGSFVIKVSPIAKALGTLGEKVEEWISTEMALKLDERIAREEQQSNFGKGETRVTGKTAKKKAKRLGESPAT